ncbi:thyrotropin releasing hormone [Tenrec ecaudatus]|uniref:thyrotropin releasing hormone n=1 Tax=Tenrec ecaudatus TaxID=94439 RepID=UPI003F595EFE
MPSPWLLLALALTLTGVPGSAQPEALKQRAIKQASLQDLLLQAERLLLLQEDLQPLPLDQGEQDSAPHALPLDWLSKRQHPGKREEEAEEGVEREDENGNAEILQRRQHPGRRAAEASWSADVTRNKRQHPGRRSPWLGYIVTKRQHPGKRSTMLVDPQAQGSWEGEEEEEEGELVFKKRQHPGRRALAGPCGSLEACDQATFLIDLGDLSQGAKQKRQHPGRRATWAREALEE